MVQTFVNETDELVHVFVKDEEIVCTNEHPFYLPQKGWIAACELRAGDILVAVNGQYVVVEKVQHEILEQPVKVYNFEVESYHTYFVSGVNILVHNTCGETSATKLGRQIHKSWDFGSNVKKEVTIPGVGRADGVDFINHIVYELKPNNARAIRQGWRQLTRYVNALEKMDNGKWIYILVTYSTTK